MNSRMLTGVGAMFVGDFEGALEGNGVGDPVGICAVGGVGTGGL